MKVPIQNIFNFLWFPFFRQWIRKTFSNYNYYFFDTFVSVFTFIYLKQTMYTMICSVAAVVYLQFVLHVMLSHMWNMFSIIIITFIVIIIPLSPVQLPLMGQGLLIIKASRSHLDMLHCVGFHWMSDQLDAGTSSWQHTTVTRDRSPCPQWDLNPQSLHHTLDHMAT